jgi:ParB-like nuclease family protein
MIQMLEQHSLQTNRKLIKPWDNLDDLIESMKKKERIKRPLLVLENGEGVYKIVDGLRRLRAIQRVGYTGPLPAQVIEFDDEGFQAVLKYLEEVRDEEGVMPLPRLYEIYGDMREFAINQRIRNRRNGVRGVSFLNLFCKAVGIVTWKFGDYVTWRARIRGHEDKPEVQRYRVLVDNGTLGAVTATMRLGRAGIITTMPSDARASLPVTPSPLTPKQQLKILENTADQLDSVISAVTAMGRIHESLTAFDHPELRKRLANGKRVLTILVRAIDDNGRDVEL